MLRQKTKQSNKKWGRNPNFSTTFISTQIKVAHTQKECTVYELSCPLTLARDSLTPKMFFGQIQFTPLLWLKNISLYLLSCPSFESIFILFRVASQFRLLELGYKYFSANTLVFSISYGYQMVVRNFVAQI